MPSINKIQSIKNTIRSKNKKKGLFEAAFIIYGILLIIISFVLWAGFFRIDEITQGDGKIIPSTEVKSTQHLEGGTVKEIHVRIGERVAAGSPLISVDPLKQKSELQDTRSDLQSISLEILRHEAILQESTLLVPQELKSNVDIEAHKRAFDAEKIRYNAELAALDADIVRIRSELEGIRHNLLGAKKDAELATSNAAIAARLAESGAYSEYERIREERDSINSSKEYQRLLAKKSELEQQIRQATSKKLAVQKQTQADKWSKLSQLYSKKYALLAKEEAAEDRVDRSVVRAPTEGVVKHIYVNSVGAVIQPGAPVVEIVPEEDDLLVEARVSPKDIGFIRIGQKAVIKIAAFDFSVYGGLNGVIEHISPDSITTKEKEFYIIRARIKNGYSQSSLRLKPGMTASVDVITGNKTILQYLLKPIVRGIKESFSER